MLLLLLLPLAVVVVVVVGASRTCEVVHGLQKRYSCLYIESRRGIIIALRVCVAVKQASNRDSTGRVTALTWEQ